MNPLYSRIIVVAALFFSTVTLYAQRISGTVIDSLGTPIAHASVTEVDINHRILSSTRTDEAGNFNMNLRNVGQTRLRINADGFMMFTQPSQKGQLQKFVMHKRSASRLSLILQANKGRKQNYVLTEKLLCGRGAVNNVPWMVMVELIGDSTFVLRLPVRASDSNAIYNEGRSITFLDWADGQFLSSFNGEDATPVVGHPNERSTWKSVAAYESGLFEMRHGYSDTQTDEDLYFYPAFLLTYEEMQHLLTEADHFGRLLIDTEQADNFWMMYPTSNFGKELQKVLKKLYDNAAKQKAKEMK